MTEERYYTSIALAGIRGYLKRTGKNFFEDESIFLKKIEELTEEQKKALFEAAEKTDFKLYRFKRQDRILPRIQKVQGFLRGICFESLLDVGSGRGAFLFPFMDEFPHVKVKSVDILKERFEMLSDVQNGGNFPFEAKLGDVCSMPFPNKSVDVVTLLEVLEHIPDVEKAIKCAVSMAKQYVVLTVPSKEDNNPEHIHLLTKEKLTRYFNEAGVEKLSFGGVSGHLFMIGKVN